MEDNKGQIGISTSWLLNMGSTANRNNFWKMYPAYTEIEPFKDFYKEDKSRGKKDSSDFMWATIILIDKSEHNPLRNEPEDEKKHVLEQDMFEGANPGWHDKEEIIIKFRDLNYSKTERDLIEWETKLEERRKFIRDTPYSLDSVKFDDKGKAIKITGTAKQLDDMAANTEKIYGLMNKLEEKVKAEKEQEGVTKGGREK